MTLPSSSAAGIRVNAIAPGVARTAVIPGFTAKVDDGLERVAHG